MIGTHNSMSYLPPKRWWMKPFRWIAQCQSKSLEEQYKLGARIFDIRIDYNDAPVFKHGLMEFKGNVYETLKYLNSLEGIYVRLTLETSKANLEKENSFIRDCSLWEKQFQNITFFNATRKFDWKRLYKFKVEDLPLTQLVGSMSGRKIYKLYPKLYSLLHNRQNLEVNRHKEFILIDFIEMQ